jgi:hypothetical protein
MPGTISLVMSEAPLVPAKQIAISIVELPEVHLRRIPLFMFLKLLPISSSSSSFLLLPLTEFEIVKDVKILARI